MASPVPKVWTIGELAAVRSLLCRIIGIQKNLLGINLYTVEFVDSKHVDVVYKQELSDTGLDQLFANDEELSTVTVDPSFLECTNSDDVKPAPVQNKGRHVQLSEEDILDIANSRLSKNTEEQTRWAICLYKGIYMYSLKKLFYTVSCIKFVGKGCIAIC